MSRTHKTVVRDDVLPDLPLVGTHLHTPHVGDTVLVELPGERMRAVVAKVLSPFVIIVELTDLPLMCNKSHHHEKGAFVPCERVKSNIDTIWRAFIPSPAPPETPSKRRKRKAPVAG